jgi:uroporphyrinogen-III synthase
VAAITSTMAGLRDGLAEMDFLHEISSRMAAADSLHLVLDRMVDFITSAIACDSCFIYVLEGDNLMLRASKNPHADLIDHIKAEVGQGVTGWVAKHRQPVAIASAAFIALPPHFAVPCGLTPTFFRSGTHPAQSGM